jgi:hypothetical protein
MDRELRKLEAKCDAQSHIIDLMLGQLIDSGLLDADAMIRKIDTFVASPTSINVDPVGAAAMQNELHAWAEVLDRYESNT